MRFKDGWDGFGSSVNLNLSGVYKFNKNNPVIAYKNAEFILNYKNENTAINFIDKVLKSNKELFENYDIQIKGEWVPFEEKA